MTRSRQMLCAALCILLAALLAACSGAGATAPLATLTPAPEGTSASAPPSTEAAAPTEAGAEPSPIATAATATETGAATVVAEPTQPDTASETAPMPEADFLYGVMQPVSDPADIRSPERVAEGMRQIKALGSNTTLQLFPPDMPAEDWKRFLDVAQQEGVHVIARLGPVDWNPDPNDLSLIMNILDVVGEHPALYGFIYLHEPWEVMNTSQMQGIYQQIKAAHPALKLGVIWSGELPKAARKNDPNRTFTDGLCDICLVNLKAFQEDPRASEKDGTARLQQSVQVLQQVDPDAEIWSSAQVWAPEDGGRRGFRVPEPAEMEALLCTVNADHALTGFLWASWTLPLPGIAAIADSELTPQREAVQSSYQSCIARP